MVLEKRHGSYTNIFMIKERVDKLLEKGYKPYRFISTSKWNKESYDYAMRIKSNTDVVFEKENGFYIETEFYSKYLRQNFNTQVNGGLCVILSKDLKFKHYFVVGIHERDEVAIIRI